MVSGIPIYEVKFGEGLVKPEKSKGNTFAYAVEAKTGPIKEPILISTNAEAKRVFGINLAPHFYQKGAPIYMIRVAFPEMKEASITYQAKIADTNNSATVDILKVSSVTPGEQEYKVSINNSMEKHKAYNLTISIEDVVSKKYTNLSSLASVAKIINNKFGNYLVAELLIDEKQALKLKSTDTLVKTSEGKFEVRETENEIKTGDVIYSKGPFSSSRLVTKDKNSVVLTGGSCGKLRTTNGDISSVSIPATGIQNATGTGTGDNEPNIDTTLRYAYREAFDILANKDILGVATLSNQEVVQNELDEYIKRMIDPEVYRYRMGVTAIRTKFDSNDPDKIIMADADENGSSEIDINRITESNDHLDNPFLVMIGQGVIFEEDGVQRKLLPHEAVPLYTGLRSSLFYGESIYGGNSKKVLIGVKDVLPLIPDTEVTREDVESVNEAGLITFKKEYEEITFLEGVTTAQDSPVLSHESVVIIVLNVLKRLVRVSKPYQGEPVTEDLKSSLINSLNEELKNITDTDKTLVALEDYNIPPYAVDVETTVIAGFNEAGEYIRETHYLVTVKIVPIGTLRSITLSVIVI